MSSVPSERDRRTLLIGEYEAGSAIPDEDLDELCLIAAQICRTPLAFVSLLDRDRQWLKGAHGIETRELERRDSLAERVTKGNEVIELDDQTAIGERLPPLLTNCPNVCFAAGRAVHAYDGTSLGALLIADVSPRKLETREREALSALARQVEQRLELRRVEALRKRLVAFVVHDMRNTLTALSADATYVHAHLPNELSDVVDASENVLIAMTKLERTTRNMLDLTAALGRTLPVNVELCDIVGLVDDLGRNVRRLAGRRQVALKISANCKNRVIETDGDLLRRILENLIHNGLDHAPPGSDLRILLDEKSWGIEITVEDRGAGIPDAEKSLVFESGFSRGRLGQRSGLGLAFCRTAADALTAELTLEDARPTGTRFLVRLPKAVTMKSQSSS